MLLAKRYSKTNVPFLKSGSGTTSRDIEGPKNYNQLALYIQQCGKVLQQARNSRAVDQGR